MILKAGTYRFNDDLPVADEINADYYEAEFEFTTTLYFPEGYDGPIHCDCSKMWYNSSPNSTDMEYTIISTNPNFEGMGIEYPFNWYAHGLGGWNESMKNVTLPNDVVVNDHFGTFFKTNTNYNEVNAPVSITYNEQVIASLNSGETATLSCSGKKMLSDVEVKVESGYIKPSGSISITENNTYDVTNYARAVVDVAQNGTPQIALNEAVMEMALVETSDAVVGSVYRYRGEASETYEYDALYILEEVSE